MKKTLTEIAYILDRSGSMGHLIEPAISGFNRLLSDQQSSEGDARLSLVLFDDEYQLIHNQVPITEVPGLDTATYVPRGCTALLDAIGKTIDRLGARLAAEPEDQRPKHVIVAIFTDGYENASRDYTVEQINQMIRHQREVYSWEFLFLAANQDAMATAAQYGIRQQDSASVQYSSTGINAASASISRKAKAMRKMRAGLELDALESADLNSSLHDIVQDEEAKE